MLRTTQEAFQAHGTVEFVDYSKGNESGFVRFAESNAAAAVAKLTADGTEIGGAKPTLSVLEGAWEEAGEGAGRRGKGRGDGERGGETGKGAGRRGKGVRRRGKGRGDGERGGEGRDAFLDPRGGRAVPARGPSTLCSVV